MYTSVFGIIFLVFIIGLIGYFPDTRVSLYVGMVWVAALLIGYAFKLRNDRKKQAVALSK